MAEATLRKQYSLVPARGECGSGIGEWREGFPGDMPGIRAPGEGPETWGEPGHWPLWLGDTMAYGELGSRGPTWRGSWSLDTKFSLER